MSRSTDPVIVRAEVALLTSEQRVFLAASSPTPLLSEEELVEEICWYRDWTYRDAAERVREHTCDCERCAFGRALDTVGLLE